MDIKKFAELQRIELRKRYIFLVDIAVEFQLDRSNLRRFALKNDIPLVKLKHPDTHITCIAFTKKDAKQLIKLKFGG